MPLQYPQEFPRANNANPILFKPLEIPDIESYHIGRPCLKRQFQHKIIVSIP
jgi:hypothetical protein